MSVDKNSQETIKKDLVIVGAGPAGLTASIYATRALLDHVVLEQESVGGQVVLTNDIDNYPGLPHVSGFDLGDAMKSQAEDLGSQILSEPLLSLAHNKETGLFELESAKSRYEAKAVIMASGAVPRKAGFKGEKEFYGKGVSYCATCDAMFYRNKLVFVVGGGNSACEEALFLTRFASKVRMLVRKDHMRAQANLIQEVEANEKIEVEYLTSPVELKGGELVSELVLRNNETQELRCERFEEGSFGVFVFVGYIPRTELFGDLAELSETGSVVTDETMQTKTPGLFAAGDVREKYLRQIITAAADGAIAATAVSEYLGHPVFN